MGIDITQTVKVGFIVSLEHLNAVFGEETPEVFHFEDRFDPRTGKKIGSEKILDNYSSVSYKLNGNTYHDIYKFTSVLEKALGANIYPYGDNYHNENNFVIGIGHETVACDAKRCPESGAISLYKVIHDLPALELLGTALTKLGLVVGKPEIVNCYTIS